MNLSNVFRPSRNQPFVVKSLNRVLANLEDQAGCVAQLLIASVDPAGGNPSIQKYVFPVIFRVTYPHVRFPGFARGRLSTG